MKGYLCDTVIMGLFEQGLLITLMCTLDLRVNQGGLHSY